MIKKERIDLFQIKFWNLREANKIRLLKFYISSNFLRKDDKVYSQEEFRRNLAVYVSDLYNYTCDLPIDNPYNYPFNADKERAKQELKFFFYMLHWLADSKYQGIAYVL